MEQQDNPDKQTPERRAGNDKNDPLAFEPILTDFPSLFYTSTITWHAECASGEATQMPRDFFHPPDKRAFTC
jgi:hypothetical protein